MARAESQSVAFSARKNAEKATTVVGKMPPEAEKELADAPEGLVDWLTGGKRSGSLPGAQTGNHADSRVYDITSLAKREQIHEKQTNGHLSQVSHPLTGAARSFSPVSDPLPRGDGTKESPLDAPTFHKNVGTMCSPPSQPRLRLQHAC